MKIRTENYNHNLWAEIHLSVCQSGDGQKFSIRGIPFHGVDIRDDSWDRYGNATIDMRKDIGRLFVFHADCPDGFRFLEDRGDAALVFQCVGATEFQTNPVAGGGGIKMIRRFDQSCRVARGMGESPVLLEGGREVCSIGIDGSLPMDSWHI